MTSSSGPLGRLATRLVLAVVLLAVLVVFGTAFRIWQFARVDDRSRADVIVVFGAAEYNGTPSKILASRLDHAQQLYNDGVARHIVTVGGREPGDNYTEAGAGRTYLNRHGVPREALVAVPSGRDTLRSAQAAAAVMSRHGWRSAVLVSDPWHMLRATAMMRASGVEAWSSPTRSGPAVHTRDTELHSIVRETGALLYYRLTRGTADPIDGRG